MTVLRELAPAKVNLYLYVTGKRADGYHLLDSLVGFTDIADTLEVMPSDRFSLHMEGAFREHVPPEDNSVLKAAMALEKHANINACGALTLHKQLPVAAGVGGGSADAAATLRLLMRFWKLKPDDQELLRIALALGADVPACLSSKSLYMRGIGELLETGPVLSGTHLVLVNPGKPLKTSEVFAEFKGPFSAPVPHPDSLDSLFACVEFLSTTRNDLQAPAIRLMPEIATVLDALLSCKDCVFARMSGSGATCFGIFRSAQAAQVAAEFLSRQHPAWWVKETTIR